MISEIRQEEEFTKIIKESKGIVLVDFYADDCPLCRKLLPTLMEVKEDYPKEVLLFRANIKNLPRVSKRMGIRMLPTVYFYRSGEVLGLVAGNRRKKVYTNQVEKLLHRRS